jgi:hypothetical protein
VRIRNGRQTTLDGPFAETKEVLGGFNLIEADNIDEAVRMAAEFPWAQTGTIEVRPVRDIETCGGESAITKPLLHRLTWALFGLTILLVWSLPASTQRPASPASAAAVPERRIVRSAPKEQRPLPVRWNPAGSWPSFRGVQASGVADGQRLPDRWDGKSGRNILWRTTFQASRIRALWCGDKQCSSPPPSAAIPRRRSSPGLYGDGDASEDRSIHRWMIIALDTRSGKIRWQRVASEGRPLNKRHIKSTYASATPVTDGRIVVAWFGSQGVYAYDVRRQLPMEG